MKWAAWIEYIPDSDRVNLIRPEHRAYLTSLLDAGQLVCAGPLTDNSGALIVYEAESQEAALQLIQADPFHTQGIFVRWQLRPWKCVMANPQLLPPHC